MVGGNWSCSDDIDTTVPNTDTKLTEGEVDKFVANNNYAIGPHTVDTKLSHQQVVDIVQAAGHVTGAHTVDTKLSPQQVEDIVQAAGHVTGAHTVNTDTLAALKCKPGQVPKWDGKTWACANDIDTNVPSGMVGFFAGACPPNWQDLSSSFGGRAVVIAPKGGALGGTSKVGAELSNMGKRTIASVAAHTHTGPSHTHKGAAHTHGLSGASGTTDYAGGHVKGAGGPGGNLGGGGHSAGQQVGVHSHKVTISGETDSSGTGPTGPGGTGATGSTGDPSVDVTMPYLQLKACQAP